MLMYMARRQVEDLNSPCACKPDEIGGATIIALLIMALLFIFVALALSRVTTEALIMGNDSAQARAFYAAQASLEMMTRSFNKIFEVKPNPSQSDLDNIVNNNSLQNSWQSLFPGYQFAQQVFPNNVNQIVTQNGVVIAGGPYEGLKASRDAWRFTTTVTEPTGAQVQLTRTFYSNRIPIFQFGIFYDGDMFFSPGGTMWVGGRVHTNGHLYLRGNDLHFQGRITAAGEIVTDVSRNGESPLYPKNVYVTDGAGGEQQVTQGSVINGPDTTGADPTEPNGSPNPAWNSFAVRFNGNLVAHAPRLRLPLQQLGFDPEEIIRRGSPSDSVTLAAARFFNKASIRITLDDSKDRLPGCAGVSGPCGRRLDGDADGLGGQTTPDRGYQPKPMLDGFQATRVNGHRFYTGPSYDGNPRQTWIKVELVTPNPSNPAQPTTVDITEDFLSLGLTDETPPPNLKFVTAKDDRAIIKIQRYMIMGPPIKVADITSTNNTAVYTQLGGKNYYTYTTAGIGASYVVASTPGQNVVDPNEAAKHARAVCPASASPCTPTASIIPFPIEMFDAREGLYSEDITSQTWNAWYKSGSSNDNLPWRGVMSLIDIDVRNLRRFMNGEFDGKFPNGLTSAQVPQEARGLIIYISDRRGDRNNNGIYDMENIYVSSPNEDATTQTLERNEDVFGTNGLTPDGSLQADYVWESCRYSDWVEADKAALYDHKYYRRAVRLINGTQLPGDPVNNKGFTLASENGVYILGNYNATGASAPTGGQPTPSSGYMGTSVPAAILADAITILSNVWNDGKSFRNPLNCNISLGGINGRLVPLTGETTVRAAFLMGVTRSSVTTNPNQGGHISTVSTDGGVMNFPRFLEYWGTGTLTRLNYCGSMVSLFWSRVNNGSFKFGNGSVYSAPDRNWTFDTNFEDLMKIPPGTPFLQYVQVTGFRRTNE